MKHLTATLFAFGILLLSAGFAQAQTICPSDSVNGCGPAAGCATGQRCVYENAPRFVCRADSSCPTTPSTPEGGDEEDAPEEADDFNIFKGPNSENFEQLNPLEILNSPVVNRFTSPAGIVNRVLLFLFPLAGLALFVMLVWGGFDILSNAHNSSGLKAGRERITTALIGFFLLFASFWIIQIVQWVFGLSIL